ncbi:hypothetical protein [Rummeliibacillus stabekisii]|uniref:hypothetical protein n=1 Tax=Rummeliibacillus stabekisii TaxID=241244 RepID=UPI003D814B27
MTKKLVNERKQMAILTIEQLNQQDHLVRKLDEALEFSFTYPLVENLYSVENFSIVCSKKQIWRALLFIGRATKQFANFFYTATDKRAACSIIDQCTQSKNKQKMIQRHI